MSTNDPLPPALMAFADYPSWCPGKYEERNGKRTKVPKNPRTGRNASTTDATTWGTLTQAIAARDRYGCDFIGLMLTPALGITGIDLDHCLDPETGAVQPWATAIVAASGSYTEPSVSGTGLRSFVLGNDGGKGRRAGAAEIYCRARYITVTGNHLDGTPDTLADWTGRIDVLRDIVLTFGEKTKLPKPAKPEAPAAQPHAPATIDVATRIQKMLSTSPKAARLWAGDTSEYDDDHSRADAALCAELMWWLDGDSAAVEAAFGDSGLNRDKWNRADYRQSTIDLALSGFTGGYTGRPPTPTRPSIAVSTATDTPCPELAQRVAELDAKVAQLEDERTAIMGVLGNQHLNAQERINYLMLTFTTHSARSRGVLDNGVTRIYAPEQAERAGCSPQTLGRSYKRFAKEYGVALRETPREVGEKVNVETGEIITRDRTVLYAGVRGDTLVASLRIGAELVPEAGKAPERGGKRTKRVIVVPPCPDHPDAGTVTRCTRCDLLLAETLDVQLESPTPPVVTTKDRQLERPSEAEAWAAIADLYVRARAPQRDNGRVAPVDVQVESPPPEPDESSVSPEEAARILVHPRLHVITASGVRCDCCDAPARFIDDYGATLCRRCAPAADLPPESVREFAAAGGGG